MDTLRLDSRTLALTYGDEEWRRSFYEVHHLTQFLSDCILCEDYKIPDDIPSLVPLTELGNEVLNKLVRKNDVNAKVARLLCLLTLVHREPLVDFDAVDVDALRASIDAQLRARHILLPFMLGRDLYDRAADLFEEPRNSLPHEDTLKLLDELPVGVFQSGPFLSGPFGLLRVADQRWFAPTRTIPMYHCSELTCPNVHTTHLTTDHASPIVRDASVMRRVLETYGDDESEWREFLEDVGQATGEDFDDESAEPVILALGDLLADDELRVLLSDLLDTTGGVLRERVKPLGLVGRSADIVEPLKRAELIQLILLADQSALVRRIDHLITARDEGAEDAIPRIKVGPDEVRRPMTTHTAAYGVFRLYPEMSNLGIRFKSDSIALGPMRLKRLVESLYDFSSPDDLRELEWQLRSVEGEDPRERLDEFVRSASPREVVNQLVLSRDGNQVAASQRLGVAYDRLQDDTLFVNALLWKLGFYANEPRNPNRDFWVHLEQFKRFVETAGVGSRIDNVDLRSKAMNCFVHLEGVLDQALAFSTWALTVDHLKAERPFAYAAWRERLSSFDKLNSFESERRVPRDEPITLTKANNLGSLIPSFGTLGDLLKQRQANRAEHRRASEDYPFYSQHTDLKKFPFAHTAPFLDLLDRSQQRILNSLEDVRQTLEQAETAGVRNDFGHYRSALPELSRVQQAIVAIESAVRRLEADGLAPVPYVSIGVDGDDWGRRVYRLRSSNGRELAFARPSPFDWSQTPSLRGAQYVMPSAVFARPNEMLRFRIIDDTPYANYWSNYPRRRRRRGAIGVNAPTDRLGAS